MTTYEKIVQSIQEFGCPYQPDLYTGDSERYFTYNYADDRGALFADNVPQTVIAGVQVHFYMPATESFSEIKNKIRTSLLRNGFTFPAITVLTEKEKSIRHIIFECEIEENEEE